LLLLLDYQQARPRISEFDTEASDRTACLRRFILRLANFQLHDPIVLAAEFLLLSH